MNLRILPCLYKDSPTVLLEAMSLGVPVVASATGDITQIVTDDWNGKLAEPRNESSLAAKCMSVSSNRSLADRRVHNASREVYKYYVTETVVPL